MAQEDIKKTDVIKKFFMKHMWRFQQCQSIIAIIVWSLTIAGVFYDKVAPLYERWGIFRYDQVWEGMLLLILVIMGTILLFGMVYDVYLKMWKPQQIIAVERNPYAKERQNAKEIVHWQYFHLPQFRAQAKILENQDDPRDRKQVTELRKYCDMINNWNTYNIRTDKKLKNDVGELIELIKRPPTKTFEEVLEGK